MLAAWIGMFLGFLVAPMPAFALKRGQKIWFAAGLGLLLAGTALRRPC